MRFIELGINKFEVEGQTISCVSDGVLVESFDLSSPLVSTREGVNTTVMFREARVLVAFSPVEWDYLCGRIDSLLVPADAAPVTEEVTPVAEEAAPVAEEAVEASVAPSAFKRRRTI
jgi:hypothetical protein